MDLRPVGIFDSGLGGLTVAKALRELMPEESFVYFGDTGRMPYGPRPAEQLRRMAVQNMEFVASFGVKAIIAACGTVSSTAPDLLESFRLPVFGVLKAGVRALAAVPGDEPVAVIATEASIKSGAYARAFQQAAPGRELICVACPAFVPLIESGHNSPEDRELRAAAETYLSPIREAGAAALLLGCTHYGIIEETVGRVLGPETELISAAGCAARDLRDYLAARGLEGGGSREDYYTSGSVERFNEEAAAFLGWSVEGRVRQVPVMDPDT